MNKQIYLHKCKINCLPKEENKNLKKKITEIMEAKFERKQIQFECERDQSNLIQ